MNDEAIEALEELANQFENAGTTQWSGQQVADALRRYAHDPEAALTNRPEKDD
jgi:hypothetical protein